MEQMREIFRIYKVKLLSEANNLNGNELGGVDGMVNVFTIRGGDKV